MKVLKGQNKTMVNTEEVNNKTNVDNDDVREKIKNFFIAKFICKNKFQNAIFTF